MRYPTRKVISVAVCEALDWRRPDGRLKDMSCRVALLRMQEDGLIRLPAPSNSRTQGRAVVQLTVAGSPRSVRVGTRRDLGPLTLCPTQGRGEVALWREFVTRYHYLGYTPMAGAQIRYFARTADGEIVALLGFGASAWKLASRDQFIGWSPEQRQARLHLIVNNARFLILPWIQMKNLASTLLGQAARQLPDDWQRLYSYRPVLLETMVEQGRFAGTSYKAANWIRLGETAGRGKMDRYKLRALPVKDVYVYPLTPDFRSTLQAPL